MIDENTYYALMALCPIAGFVSFLYLDAKYGRSDLGAGAFLICMAFFVVVFHFKCQGWGP